jgi:hypothetical protein
METLSCSGVAGAMELFDVPGIVILLLTLYRIGGWSMYKSVEGWLR